MVCLFLFFIYSWDDFICVVSFIKNNLSKRSDLIKKVREKNIIKS